MMSRKLMTLLTNTMWTATSHSIFLSHGSNPFSSIFPLSDRTEREGEREKFEGEGEREYIYPRCHHHLHHTRNPLATQFSFITSSLSFISLS